jgi:hypothetical protein
MKMSGRENGKMFTCGNTVQNAEWLAGSKVDLAMSDNITDWVKPPHHTNPASSESHNINHTF